MTAIKIYVPHNIGQIEAIKRIENFSRSIPSKYGSHISNFLISWNGGNSEFSFVLGKIKVKGHLNVNNSSVSINCSLPIVFFLLKNQITKAIIENALIILQDRASK